VKVREDLEVGGQKNQRVANVPVPCPFPLQVTIHRSLRHRRPPVALYNLLSLSDQNTKNETNAPQELLSALPG